MKALLLNPLIIFFLLLLTSLLWRKFSHAIRWIAISYLYLATIPLTTQILVHYWAISDNNISSTTYDYILPLGGMTDYKWYLNRQASSLTPLQNYYRLNENGHRIITAIDLVASSKAKILLLVDNTTDNFNEASLLKDFANAQQIEPGRISTIGEATNTHEEALQAALFLESSRDSLLLITSELHMRRALHTFQKAGLNPHAFSSGRISREISAKSFIPSTTGLRLTQDLLYEVSGYIFYWFKGWF